MSERTTKWHHRPAVHWLACPIRSRWLRRRNRQPFWRDDKVAQMLGVAWYGCGRCGRGAITERTTPPAQPDGEASA